jgi:hypothetical protein
MGGLLAETRYHSIAGRLPQMRLLRREKSGPETKKNPQSRITVSKSASTRFSVNTAE